MKLLSKKKVSVERIFIIAILLSATLQLFFLYRFKEKDVKKYKQLNTSSDIITPQRIPAVIIAGTQKGVSHSIIIPRFYFDDSFVLNQDNQNLLLPDYHLLCIVGY